VVKPNMKLMDEVRTTMRLKHYSIHTERSYCDWIRRYVRFHGFKHREDLLQDSEALIEAFLTHLAVNGQVAKSTQNQAMNALVFLYRRVLKRELTGEIDAIRATRNKKVPVVLTPQEVQKVLSLISGSAQLIAQLLYGSGLRISEALRLRVKDIDFGYQQLIVRSGKGEKDRVTPFPVVLEMAMKQQLQRVKVLHDNDLKEGFGEVYLPYALDRKYPQAGVQYVWQYVFPSENRSRDPRSGKIRRHHLDQSVVNKSIKRAIRQLGIAKQVTAHTFRHSFATHLLQSGTDIRTIQALLGHQDLKTTMIYTHVINHGGMGVTSPLDRLDRTVGDELNTTGIPRTN